MPESLVTCILLIVSLMRNNLRNKIICGMHSVKRWLRKTQGLIVFFCLKNGPYKNSPQELVTKIKNEMINKKPPTTL